MAAMTATVMASPPTSRGRARSPRMALGSVWLGIAGGFLGVATLLAPWVQAGSTGHSSIDLLRTAGALDVVDGPARLAASGVWFLLPTTLAAALLAAMSRRPGLARLLTFAAGSLLSGASIVVERVSQSNGGLSGAWGVKAALVVGVATCAVSLLSLIAPRMFSPPTRSSS